MIFFYSFILAFLISFIGSLQPGPVNLAVFAACMNKQNKNAVYIAIGGSIPEFVFCLIALQAASYVLLWEQYFFYFQIALSVLLFIGAILLWFNKKSAAASITQKNGLGLGLVLASLNPQLILFWTSVIAYIQVNHIFNINLFETTALHIIFSIGATLGAFALHFSLIVMSKSYIHISMESFFKYADKLIAVIFAILSLFQTIKLFL